MLLQFFVGEALGAAGAVFFDALAHGDVGEALGEVGTAFPGALVHGGVGGALGQAAAVFFGDAVHGDGGEALDEAGAVSFDAVVYGGVHDRFAFELGEFARIFEGDGFAVGVEFSGDDAVVADGKRAGEGHEGVENCGVEVAGFDAVENGDPGFVALAEDFSQDLDLEFGLQPGLTLEGEAGGVVVLVAAFFDGTGCPGVVVHAEVVELFGHVDQLIGWDVDSFATRWEDHT